jgi:transcription-repair coupling factor (superfamily II helicase)
MVQIDAGPLAIALTPADKQAGKRLSAATKRVEQAGDRLICKLGEGAQVLTELSALLYDMAS